MKLWAYNLSVKVAFESTYLKYRHGAVIEYSGTVLTKGTNSLKPFNPTAGWSTHAVVAAINRAGKKKVAGANLYVTRVGKDGTLRHSKPCPNCIKKIKASGVRHVYYSISENEFGTIKLW